MGGFSIPFFLSSGLNSIVVGEGSIRESKLGNSSVEAVIPEPAPPKNGRAMIVEEPFPLPPKDSTLIAEPTPLPPKDDEYAELASDDTAMLLEDAELISSPLTLQANTNYTGNVAASATINLNGYKLTIGGNFTQTSGSTNFNGGRLEVSGNCTFNDGLYMKNEADYLLCGGNFTIGGGDVPTDHLTAGTVEIKGNFSQATPGNRNYYATGTHKTIFSGTGRQEISFACSEGNYANKFNVLDVQNNKKTVFTSTLYGLTLHNDMVINESIEMSTTYGVNLNGHTLTINGNLVADSGAIACNGGRLKVNGNCTLNGGLSMENGAGYAFCSGDFTVNNGLYMKDEADYLLCGGNFTIGGGDVPTDHLTAGTVEIKGNFSQATSGNRNYYATGTHETILSGKGVQEVTFANPTGNYANKFNKLVVNKSEASYKFNYTPCWNEYIRREIFDRDNPTVSKNKYLIRVVSPSGKPLSGVSVTYNSQSGVTSGDGYVLFDLLSVGDPLITATLNGYLTWSNENSNWTKSSNRQTTIILYPINYNGLSLQIARYKNGLIETDLLVQTQKLNLKSEMAGDLSSGNFAITCSALDDSLVSEYQLWQKDVKIASNSKGDFSLNVKAGFTKGSGCFIRVIGKDGKTADTGINLSFVENVVQKETGVSVLKDKIGITVSDDVPFLGGSTFNVGGVGLLPVETGQWKILCDEK